MKIVIVGAGLLGIQIARELIAEQRDVVIIERNADTARSVGNELDCMVVEGDGENMDILRDAGTAEADWFIALAGSDEANIVACGLVAEAFPTPHTIALVRSHYFGSFHRQKQRFLGVDYILNPEAETAEAIVRIIRKGLSTESFALKEAGVTLKKISCAEDRRFPGAILQDIRSAIGNDFIVPAVVRKASIIVPAGDFQFAEDDFAYILGAPDVLHAKFGMGRATANRISSFVMFGADALARRVLTELGVPGPEGTARMRRAGTEMLAGNSRITVIDEAREEVKTVARSFPDVEAICRGFSEESLFAEESIDRADLVLCMTGSQSYNIVTALLARQAGAKQALAVVYNDLYMHLESTLDIDALVNQKAIVAGAVLDMVRKADIHRLHSFAEGDLELVELRISPTSHKAGSTVKDIGLPKGILIAFIIHQGTTIIPRGDSIVHPGDTVGVVLRRESMHLLETVFGD